MPQCDQPSSTKPFFEHIPYDVRYLIYEYMDLPPVHHGAEIAGFYLSCRQAKEELEEVSMRATKKYLKKHKESMEALLKLPVEIPAIDTASAFKDLQYITLRIPYSKPASSVNNVVETPGPIHVLCGPLLERYFKKKTAVITNNEDTSHGQMLSPKSAVSALESELTSILGRPQTPIRSGGASRRMRQRDPFSTLFERLRTIDPRHVKVRKIALAWDLRSDELRGTDVALRGNWQFRPQRTQTSNDLFVYQVRSTDGLVGEIGYHSDLPQGWDLTITKWWVAPASWRGLLQQKVGAALCTSEGIGHEVAPAYGVTRWGERW